MTKEPAIRICEGRKMRTAWDSYAGKGSFPVVHVVAVLIGFVALMGLMGCSKEFDEELESGEAICFSGQESEQTAVTRADAGLETKAQTFVVWGYKNDSYEVSTDSYTSYQLVIPGYTVSWQANTASTTTTNTNDWDYILPLYPDQTVKYWDLSARAYRFFGYALPSADPTAVVIPTGGTPYDSPDVAQVSLTANVDCTTDAGLAKVPYFSELWFSDGNPASDRPFGKPVTLRFRLPYARVRFLFIFNDDLSLTRANLDHISFHPTDNTKVPTKGNITVSYPIKGSANPKPEETWNSSVTDGVRSLNIDWYETSVTPLDPSLTTYPNRPNHWHYVLPIVSQGSYTMEVSVKGKQVQTAVVPANYMTWKPGYDYTYVFKITNTGEVTFNVVQVAINQWETTDRTVDHTVHNW